MSARTTLTTIHSGITRRKFLATAGAAAYTFSIVPRHVMGGVGYVPPSEKVNIAFVGVGSQGLRVMLEFLRQDDVQAVAVCDPKLPANHLTDYAGVSSYT